MIPLLPCDSFAPQPAMVSIMQQAIHGPSFCEILQDRHAKSSPELVEMLIDNREAEFPPHESLTAVRGFLGEE